MKILLLGHICLDSIHTEPGEKSLNPSPSLGGIYYSLATLAHLAEAGDSILPVFGVASVDYDLIMDEVSQLPNLNTKGIFKYEGESNHVHLFYGENGSTRTECSNHICKPIPFDKIKPHLNVDGILINMISGFDITLETLDQIRIETRSNQIPIHFDFHSLTLGIDQNFKRFRRALPDWRRWGFMLSSIQLSEEELEHLTLENYSEDQFINQVMPLMVNHLIITRGKAGISLVEQEHKKLTRHEIPGISKESIVDTTGCGDVFGSAFLYFYLKTKNARLACEYANGFAAHNASFIGSTGISSFSGIKNEIIQKSGEQKE